jgi:dimethylhistidine N-methyltransferase
MLDTSTLADIDNPAFAEAVLTGLSRAQKAVSSAWLYDHEGSALYEDITRLPEYYVARTETRILECEAEAMAAHLPPEATVIEYGAGAAVKTRLLLDALARPACYAPLDISAEFLLEASAEIAGRYPDIEVRPIVAHFLEANPLTEIRGQDRRVGFFPGSTVGNLTNAEIRRFFDLCREQLGADGKLLLGADREKDRSILIPAYDDAAGVTARFNLNLLARINRELAGTFNLRRFRHEARWNTDLSRIEMHLVSLAEQEVRVLDHEFGFEEGETIHTEISRKFRAGELEALAAAGGWQVEQHWTDDRDYFSVFLFRQA